MSTEIKKLSDLFYKTLSFAPPGLRPELDLLSHCSVLKCGDGTREFYMHFLEFKDGVEMILFNHSWEKFEFEIRNLKVKEGGSFKKQLRDNVYCNLASIIDSVGGRFEGVKMCEVNIVGI